MLILAKAMLAMMIGFILTIIFGLGFIPLLKKMRIGQKVSVFLEDRHGKKDGTPTMGGLIFIIPTILTTIIMILLNKIEYSDNLLIVMFVFVAYAVLGFIDDYLIIKRKRK
jgi:phospho-N-acetylmuramoyl-pentapeptide-transferase